MALHILNININIYIVESEKNFLMLILKAQLIHFNDKEFTQFHHFLNTFFPHYYIIIVSELMYQKLLNYICRKNTKCIYNTFFSDKMSCYLCREFVIFL